MTKKIIVTLLLSVFSVLSAQITNSKVILKENITVGNTLFNLKGSGYRNKVGINLYAIGLYTTKDYTTAHEMVKSNDLIAIRIVIASKVLNTKRMSNCIQGGFDQSAGRDLPKINARVNQMIQNFSKEEIKQGDTFDIKYVHTLGTLIYKNKKLVNIVRGQDFKEYFFNIWLGEDPINKKLKTKLMNE